MQECRLCKKKFEKLSNSHIIPEFMYKHIYDDKHKIHLIGPSGKIQNEQEGYKEYLLCAGCESKLSKWEGVIAMDLSDVYNKNDKYLKFIDFDPYLLVTGVQDDSFKLGILSIFWRMSISSLELFKDNKLGIYEEKIREILCNHSLLRYGHYPIVIIKVIEGDKIIIPYPKGKYRKSVTMQNLLAFGFFITLYVTENLGIEKEFTPKNSEIIIPDNIDNKKVSSSYSKNKYILIESISSSDKRLAIDEKTLENYNRNSFK